MKIEIKTNKDYQEAVRKMKRIIGAQNAMKVVGMALVIAWQKWFRILSTERATKGVVGRNSKFYIQEGAKRITLAHADAERAIVMNTSHLIAHKFYGGTIKPVNKKWLMFPVDGSVSVNMFRAGSRKTNRELSSMGVHFVRVKKVVQKPRKYVLLTQESRGDALALAEIERAVNARICRKLNADK